jgi:hypothetical protein
VPKVISSFVLAGRPSCTGISYWGEDSVLLAVHAAMVSSAIIAVFAAVFVVPAVKEPVLEQYQSRATVAAVVATGFKITFWTNPPSVASAVKMR